MQLWRKAADQGNADAQFNLGTIHHREGSERPTSWAESYADDASSSSSWVATAVASDLQRSSIYNSEFHAGLPWYPAAATSGQCFKIVAPILL